MAQIAQQDNLIVKITGDLLEELKAEGKLKEPEEEGKDNNAARQRLRGVLVGLKQ
jgi:hypothetical protein